MCDKDNRWGGGAVVGGGGYRQPHYVNKVQEHVPINRSAVRAETRQQLLSGRSPGRR